MKKLLSILLAAVLLLSLAPTALAEEPMDEPEAAGEAVIADDIAEEAEEGVTEPAAEEGSVIGEEPADEPALDGVDISGGTHNISQIAQGASLVLKGDATIVVDRDQTLGSISGNKALTLIFQNGKTLTVNNTNGHAVDIYSLTASGSGTLDVRASKNGIYTDRDIDISGVSLIVSSVRECVYSRNGNVSVRCSADLRATDGCALYARMGELRLAGDITAVTTDDDSPCILSGGTDGSSVSSGYICFEDGAFSVTAKDDAVECSFGDIEITGTLKASSSQGNAIVSNPANLSGSTVTGKITFNGADVEANGRTRGIYCGGEIFIADSEIYASGSDYAIYAGEGFTVGARLSVVTPDTGKIQGNTVMYGSTPATTVRIGLTRIPGAVEMIWPGEVPYVGDTLRLSLTGVPTPHRIQWEISEDGWNFEDIPGATGETYTIAPEELGYKIQARVTADGYGGVLRTLGAFISSRPDHTITAASIFVNAPQAGKEIPSPPKGQPMSGSPFTIGEQYWCAGMSVSWSKLTSGTFENGKTYYYYAELIPKEGYEFAGSVGKVGEEELSVTAGGASAASMAKGSDGRVTVYIPMKAAGPVFTDDIVLTGLTEPKAGAAVQSNVSSSGSAYTVTSQMWSDGWLGLSATKDTTFQDGKTYFWVAVVKLNDGCGFAEDYAGRLNINGSTVTPTTGNILDALEKGDPVRTIDASNDTMVIRISYKVGGSAQPAATDYVLDLSGASVSGSEVSGTGTLRKSDGSAPDGKKYVYIVVNYERPDGSTWAVAGTYAVDSDGEFDLPSISGVSDKVSSVLVIGVDSKTGASWAGHNITKPGRIKP